MLSRTIKTRWICPQCRFYSTPPPAAAPAPPMLLKLRSDLKTAMKAKDSNRLNVLRGLLAEITNSAKTNKPITTDMQLLSLLKKRAASAKQASSEFQSAGRQDLVEQEEGQARVLEEYAGGVEVMSEEDVKAEVVKVVEEVKGQSTGKVNLSEVMKKLLGPGGSLDGKPVEKKEVAKLVAEALPKS